MDVASKMILDDLPPFLLIGSTFVLTLWFLLRRAARLVDREIQCHRKADAGVQTVYGG